MKKQEFITRLQYKLTGIPLSDVLERIGFISESIDDRIEEGYSEEEAVRALGSIDDVAAGIIADLNTLAPMSTHAAKSTQKGKPTALTVTLIAIASPILIALAAVAVSLIISAYAVIWSVVASLWAVFGALVIAAAFGILSAPIMAFTGFTIASAVFGCALASLGLSLPAFYGCLYATKGSAWLSKQIAIIIKKIFTRR